MARSVPLEHDVRFIIVSWIDLSSILPVLKEDGTFRVFPSFVEAYIYGKPKLQSSWKVIEITEQCDGV